MGEITVAHMAAKYHERALKAWKKRKHGMEQAKAAAAGVAEAAAPPAPRAKPAGPQARAAAAAAPKGPLDPNIRDWMAPHPREAPKENYPNPLKMPSVAGAKPGTVVSSGDFSAEGRFRAIEKGLREAPQVRSKILGGGINPSFKVYLEDGREASFKPAAEELEGVRKGIRAGQMVEREIGAYEVAKIVGMDDMVAATVERNAEVPDFPRDPFMAMHFGVPMIFKGGNHRGVAAAWWEGTSGDKIHGDRARKYDGDDDLRRTALFDYIIGNTDRHHGNWVIDANGRMKLIDHGLAFGEGRTDQGNHMIQREVASREITDRERIRPRNQEAWAANRPHKLAQVYKQKKDKILAALSKLGLPKKAIDRVAMRIDRAADQDLDWAELYRDHE